jgi:hypothetical protein
MVVTSAAPVVMFEGAYAANSLYGRWYFMAIIEKFDVPGRVPNIRPDGESNMLVSA